MITTSKLESLLEEFKQAMLAKFYARVAKHPGESSVTHDNYDWAGSDLLGAKHHMVEEFLERFPEFIPRFPEVDKSHITIDPPQVEDVDMANLAFYDWAVRKEKALFDAKEKK